MWIMLKTTKASYWQDAREPSTTRAAKHPTPIPVGKSSCFERFLQKRAEVIRGLPSTHPGNYRPRARWPPCGTGRELPAKRVHSTEKHPSSASARVGLDEGVLHIRRRNSFEGGETNPGLTRTARLAERSLVHPSGTRRMGLTEARASPPRQRELEA